MHGNKPVNQGTVRRQATILDALATYGYMVLVAMAWEERHEHTVAAVIRARRQRAEAPSNLHVVAQTWRSLMPGLAYYSRALS